MQWLMKGAQLRGGRLCMCDRAVKKEWHTAELIMCNGSLGFVKVWAPDERSFGLHSHCTRRAPHSFDHLDPLQAANIFPAFEAILRLASYLMLLHLPVGRNAWLCMTCGRAQPDTPTISCIRVGFDGQLAAGPWVRNSVCQEEDSDTNWAGGSKSEWLFKGHPTANSAW